MPDQIGAPAMPAAKTSSTAPTPDAPAHLPADWSEFVAAVSYLSRPHRALIARICRRLEQVQADHGPEVAEAAVERIIRIILCEDGRYLS
jgi:hypothetical protein